MEIDAIVLRTWRELLDAYGCCQSLQKKFSSEITLFEVYSLSKNSLLVKLLDNNKINCELNVAKHISNLTKDEVLKIILTNVLTSDKARELLSKYDGLEKILFSSTSLFSETPAIITNAEKEKIVQVLVRLVPYTASDESCHGAPQDDMLEEKFLDYLGEQ